MSKTKIAPPPAPTFDPTWLDAPPERALALVEEAGERGADLVAAWIASKNAAAVAEVAAHDGAPANARKAARRGLNVLKSRGVVIPERSRRAPRADAPKETFEAWFRPPDGAGTSAFTLGARSAAGRYRLLDIIVQDGVGLVSIANMEMSRTQLRQTFDGIEERFGHAPASVPITWARYRISHARRENDVRGTPVPLAFANHVDFLDLASGDGRVHPADEAGLALPSREEALARSTKLHGESEMRGWLPAPSAMQKLLGDIAAARDTFSGIDPAAIETKIAALIDDVTDSYFERERRIETGRRMRDVAISLFERGETAHAADLLATANAVIDFDGVPAAHAIPFLRGYFEKAVGLAAARAAREGAARAKG